MMGKILRLLSCVVIVWLVSGMGLCAAGPQEAAGAGGKRSSAKNGKTLLDCFRGITIEPSSEAAIKALKALHGDFAYFWAKNNKGFSQYDTKVGTADPTLKPGALQERLRLAHEAGIKVLLVDTMGTDALAAERHPDWAFRRSDGALITILETVMCFNSPYRDYAVAVIEDLVKNYDIDGLLVDGPWWGNMGTEWCCCDYCKQAYRVKFGKEMPENLDWEKMGSAEMQQAIEWRRDSLEETYREIYTKAKAIRPNLALSLSGFASWHIGRGNLVNRTNVLRMSDFSFIEAYDDLFYTAWLRGVSRKPMLGFPQGTGEGLGSQIAKYMGDKYEAGAAALLAHGGRCIVNISYLPDGSVSENSKPLERLYRNIEEKQPYLENASPVLYAAIVYSEPVKIYYRRENEPYVTLQPLKWLPEIIDYGKDNLEDRSPLPNLKGAFDVLQKLHVPVEFLSDMDLNLESLKKFQVVILPNTAILTKPQVEAIRQYVKEGGSVLTTYETSLYNELGEPMANFDLADVFGLKYMVTRRRFDTIFEDGSILSPGRDLLTHLQDLFKGGQNLILWMPGPFAITQPTAGTVKAFLSYGVVVTTAGVGPAPIIQSPSIPAVHVNHFGRGKSVYISTPLFKIYNLPAYPFAPAPVIERFHGYPFGTPLSRRGWITDLTREILNELAPDPPIIVEGEPLMESTFFEQREEDRLIIHLFNSTVDPKSGKVSVLGPANIRIRKDFATPRKIYSAWPARIELQAKENGKYLEVTAPETRIHQIVVMER